jgi:Phosphoserine aminotransferase
MKNRVHNFSAGPATLPLEVLESIKEELINYKDIGSSIIEISHRDKTFIELAEKIEETLRKFIIHP